MRDRRLSDLSGDPAEIFLEFGFPELKALCLCFIFLSTIFFISSIFSLKKPSLRGGIIWFGAASAWAFFGFAVAIGGHGLWRLYQIAEVLVLNQREEGFVANQYSYYVRSTYSSLDLAGYALVLGILAYVGTHALQRFIRKPTLTEAVSPNDPNKPGAGIDAGDQI